MTHDDLCKLALEEAEKSTCKKRKVGAVIIDSDNNVISSGYNHNDGLPCEDSYGTLDTVVHAEVAAIQKATGKLLKPPLTMYVTHQPCDNCAKALSDAKINNVIIVEQFMKFDAGKLRYSLIPPVATEALAKVLTYGAKKYKPNNWKKVEDTERYVDALYRHLEAWRGGQEFDEESGLSHLSHALTNIAFLIWYEANKVREDNKNVSNID